MKLVKVILKWITYLGIFVSRYQTSCDASFTLQAVQTVNQYQNDVIQISPSNVALSPNIIFQFYAMFTCS